MNLQSLSKDELTDEFMRLNKAYLSACDESQYSQALKFKEIREKLLAVIEELRTRRDQRM